MSIRRVLVLSVTAVLLAGSAPSLLAQAPPAADRRETERRNQRQQQDVTALVTVVDQVAATPATAPEQTQGEVDIKWESNHFIRGGDGNAYVPFTITVDRADLAAPNAALYIRAMAKNAPAAAAPAAAPAAAAPTGNNNRNNQPAAAAPRVTYPWDNAYFLTVPADGKVQRAMQLPGGEYDVFIAVKDQGNGDRRQVAKTGLLRKTIVVPDFKAATLQTSSIMIGTIEPLNAALSPSEQQENPYTFGVMKIVPLADPKLPKTGELSLIFWIYGAGVDPVSTKPNVAIEYSFYTKTGEAEKFFNKTAPQELNAQTLPSDFSLAAGHQLPGSLGVPLTSFPAGDYRLEIKITDKVNSKTLTQNVAFSITGA